MACTITGSLVLNESLVRSKAVLVLIVVCSCVDVPGWCLLDLGALGNVAICRSTPGTICNLTLIPTAVCGCRLILALLVSLGKGVAQGVAQGIDLLASDLCLVGLVVVYGD